MESTSQLAAHSLRLSGCCGVKSLLTLLGSESPAFAAAVTAHNDVWMIKFDDEEYGPYKSQSEAVLFAINAAEKLNEHGEKAQAVIIGPTWTYDQDISRGS